MSSTGDARPASLPVIEESQSPEPQPAQQLAWLVRAATEGDQAAWNALVDRFSRLLWGICRSHRLNPSDAADVCQLTWLRLMEHLESIREPARLPGWLATTCRRECLVQLRRNKKLYPVEDERLLHLGDEAGEDGPPADLPLLVADRDAILWRAFSQLGERCQQVLKLLVVTPEDGPPSYQVVASALGLPVGSLGPTRGRCLARLRDLLDAEGISGPAPDS